MILHLKYVRTSCIVAVVASVEWILTSSNGWSHVVVAFLTIVVISQTEDAVYTSSMKVGEQTSGWVIPGGSCP